MDVVARVAHAQPVPFALFHAKHRMHTVFRKRDIVDGPPVEAALGCVLLGKGHFDDLIRRWNHCPRISELSVVPRERLGSDPPRLTLLAGIFDHRTQAMPPVVVRHIAHDPDARAIHLDNGGDPLRRAQPKSGYRHWSGDRVAIHRDHGEGVSGQRETANLGGAAVQHVEEHAFALLHPNRFTATQHSSVDREGSIPDLESMRHAFGERGVHGVLAGLFQFLDRRRGHQKLHVHVTAAAVRGFEFLQREEHFAVIIARVVLRLYIHRTHQARVLSRAQVCPRADVRVIEAIAGRLGDERNAPASVGGNERRALFRRAIDIGRQKLPMPVQLLGRVRLVVNVDGDLPAFFEAQQRPGELTVIGGGGDDAIRGQFHRLDGDGQGVIRGAAGLGLFRPGHGGRLAANGLAE